MIMEFKTQAMGLSLAALTAIGCLAYERLTKSLPYTSVCFFVWLEYFWIWIALVVSGNSGAPKISYWSENKWTITIYLISGLTSPLWYWLTRTHSVLVGGTFEMKHIIILGILAAIFGEQKPSHNTCIGAVLAVVSVYFISKR